MGDLLRLKKEGLVGGEGAFHIDAWNAAPINLVTHAHSDHARPGSAEYWCAKPCAPILRARLGRDLRIREFAYGEKAKIGDCWVSFHPAGHILGSAQVRLESASKVWVVTGDYKREPDPTCAPFEPLPCDVLVTEATFGLPIYAWPDTAATAREIYDWWQWCKQEKLAALLFCYSLGKAQRVLAELLPLASESVFLHGAIANLTAIYREQGVAMLPTEKIGEDKQKNYAGRLILAPPSAHRSPWMKRFKDVSAAFASGWMAVRGVRRRRGYERGFVLSDHADWNGLLRTARESQASRVLVTHGNSEALARYLREQTRVDAEILQARYGEEEDRS